MEAAAFINADTVRNVLDYPTLIQRIEKGLGYFSRRQGIVQPVRSSVAVSKSHGFLGCMPVYSEEDDILATKLVTFYARNKGVPSHHAIILVFHTETGVPRAILDGEVITEMRTASVSAVASKHLACEASSVLAILGSGVQARSHIAALSEVFSFHQVRVWNHHLEGAQKLAAEVGEKCQACSSVQEAVLDADIIVTVTSSPEPVLKAPWVKQGAHINAVGACRPDWAEVDADLMRSAVVYVDSYEGARKESGDILLSQAEIYAELGEVISGTKEARRKELTVFKSLGLAIEDAVGAKLVLEKLGK